MPQKKILFYVGYGSHIPHLSPIYQALRKDKRYRASLMSSTDYNNPTLHLFNFLAARAGLREDVFYSPDVTFIAHCTHQPPEGKGGIVINVNHDVGSKGTSFFDDPEFTPRENSVDYIFAPSEYLAQRLKKFLTHPRVVVTGMPKLDRMFKAEFSREEIMKKLKLKGKKVIIFAPTYNSDMSAIEVLGNSVLKLATEDTALIVKFHCKVKPKHEVLFKNPPKNVAVLDKNEPDITPYMSIADLMISDYSSAWMEFMALDKPMVLVNNPEAVQKFDDQFDFVFRNAGIEARNFEEVKDGVKRSFKVPGEKSALRKKYSDMLFDYRGESVKRCVEVLSGICNI